MSAETEREETSGEFLARLGTDGQKWAVEFRKIAVALGYSDMDEGWLIGWFANAIEAGRGAALRARPAVQRMYTQQEYDEARFRPIGDNHHNAAACPHCSPSPAVQSEPDKRRRFTRDDARWDRFDVAQIVINAMRAATSIETSVQAAYDAADEICALSESRTTPEPARGE